MQAPGLTRALEDWRGALGPQAVLTGETPLFSYSENVTGLARLVPAALLPSTTEEVAHIVRIAGEHGVGLYPISGGKNWALGSKLPVRDGTVVVDLRGMNAIRELSVPGMYAVVEAGVTQGQLHDHLVDQNAPLILNATGAGRSTSVIGNALERGIGYFASRADELYGLEVVLGTGEILRTGFGHYPTAKTTYLYRHGVGPMLDGLFAQSGFGIVTAAGVSLLPRPESHMAVIAKIPSEDGLGALIDALANLRRDDVIRTVVHVGNRHRTIITLGPLVAEQLAAEGGRAPREFRSQAEQIVGAAGFGAWSAVAGVMGTERHLRASRKEIAARLKSVATVMFVTDDTLARARTLLRRAGRFGLGKNRRLILQAIEPLYGMSKGIPTDDPLKSVYWPVDDDWPAEDINPDHGRSGILYCLPFMPMDGRTAREVVGRIEQVFDRHGFTPYMTLNIVDAKALECVVNLAFDRSDAARVTAAHACIEELQADLIERGYPPYRVGIQTMAQMVGEDDLFWQKARDLKRTLDPHNIISPGRYNLE